MDNEASDVRAAVIKVTVEYEKRLSELRKDSRLKNLECDELKRKLASYERTMGELPGSEL
jgi:hypothetical protein